MKYFLFAIIAMILITTVSCQSKTKKNARDYINKIEETMKENSPVQSDDQKTKGNPNIPEYLKKIIGEWELVKIVGDRNDSHTLDPEEDNDAELTAMQDFLKLNANGSCEYTIVKLKGRFEIVSRDDGRKKLKMYDRTGSEVNSGRYIVSVTDDKLVINVVSGGSDFMVFKRI